MLKTLVDHDHKSSRTKILAKGSRCYQNENVSDINRTCL